MVRFHAARACGSTRGIPLMVSPDMVRRIVRRPDAAGLRMDAGKVVKGGYLKAPIACRSFLRRRQIPTV